MFTRKATPIARGDIGLESDGNSAATSAAKATPIERGFSTLVVGRTSKQNKTIYVFIRFTARMNEAASIAHITWPSPCAPDFLTHQAWSTRRVKLGHCSL